MGRELPELSDYQLECLRRFLRFELSLEELREALKPLITFQLDGPSTHQQVHFSAGVPKNPIRVDREQIASAIARAKAGEITNRQLQQWATMLLLNDAFDWSGPDEDTVADLLDSISS